MSVPFGVSIAIVSIPLILSLCLGIEVSIILNKNYWCALWCTNCQLYVYIQVILTLCLGIEVIFLAMVLDKTIGVPFGVPIVNCIYITYIAFGSGY